MTMELNGATVGSGLWKLVNTGLGAAGTAMGATALGSKTNENKVREIIHEELCGCGHNGYNGYHGYNGWNRGGFNENIVIGQPCSSNTLVNRFELGQNLEIARLQAKEYSDMSDLKLFEDYTTRLANEKERVNNQFQTIYTELVASRERQQEAICRLDKEIALNKQAQDFFAGSMNNAVCALNGRIDATNNRIDGFTKEVIPLTAICPQPLAGCVPVGFQGQIVTTTPTGETNTVLSAAKVASANVKG